MNKKLLIRIIISVAIIFIGVGIIVILTNGDNKKLKPLPKPEITGGARGEFGIDRNINEGTIDDYLNRRDSVYRDMRMLEDPADYEKIGGDRYLSGYIKGFEVVPLPYLLQVTDLPEVVGKTYTGDTLFSYEDNQYVANYKESMSIIEELFPKDKVIFLMCGGGGYANMTKNFLISLGWDANKIYNIGGYWYYKGKNNVEVKKTVDGITSYDFDIVPYHTIDFDKLTKKERKETKKVSVEEVVLNSSKIVLEVGNSTKLTALVLPNEATNKSIKWSISNEQIATISSEGLVTALKEGTAEIKATSEDNNIVAVCEITVKEVKKVNPILLDNIKEIADKYNALNPDLLYEEFSKVTTDENGNTKPEYLDPDDNLNDKWLEEHKKHLARLEDAAVKRKELLNQLIDSKKSFIMFLETASCGTRPFSSVLSGESYFKDLNIPYLAIAASDNSFYESKIVNPSIRGGSIVIVKEGEIYNFSDENTQALTNRESVINWLKDNIILKS